MEYGLVTNGSIRVILVLETVLSNLMRSIQNSIFRDLASFYLIRFCMHKKVETFWFSLLMFSIKFLLNRKHIKRRIWVPCSTELNYQQTGSNETSKAIGKNSNDKLIMRNKLNQEAECICIRTQFSFLTLGAIIVAIGLVSLPIQIKLICREFRLR